MAAKMRPDSLYHNRGFFCDPPVDDTVQAVKIELAKLVPSPGR